MWREWGTPQNFLLAFMDELWKTRKSKILKKWKKNAGDTIILHFTHVRYSSWDRVRQNFLSFWAIFCPLNLENQNFEKMKKVSGDVIILNLCNKNTIKWCRLTQTWSATDIIFCHFVPFFSFTPLLTPKIKIWKKCKKHLEILSFYTCAP